jgi:septum formation protein
MTLILASQSVGRRALLTNAGVPHEAVTAGVDEDAAKASLRAGGISARNLADALAELKAVKVSRKRPGDVVLGCDQTLALDDGTMFDKAESMEALAGQLRAVSGKTHSLFSAMVIAEGGVPVWRHVERVKLTMRPLSDGFIADYLAAEGDGLLSGVGGYRIEGRGIQLFERVEGSHFAIIGLPLLPLLAYLRTRGVMAG